MSTPSPEDQPPQAGKLELAQATQDPFRQGIAAFKAEEWEQAIELLGQSLQLRTEAHGDLADEAAEVYHALGSALLAQAQASGDFFSGRGEGLSAGAGPTKEEAQATAAGDEGVPSAENDAEDEPAGPSGAAASSEDEEAEQEEEGEQESEPTDLQLAWEHLEAAKVIWGKHPDLHSASLADVHTLLGDTALENEDFESALSDYQEAAEYLDRAEAGAGPAGPSSALLRQRAEVLYKLGMAWQFQDNAGEALSAVQAAAGVLAGLETRLGDAIQDDAGASAELKDVAALRADLVLKVEELKEAVQEQATTRDVVKAALRQLAGAMVVPGTDPADAKASGFAAPTAPAAAVQDLGTIGRGTKRVVLQPVQRQEPAAGHAADEGTETESAPKPAAKKPRNLEDLMGPAHGETTTGF